jgi:FixJ family two-component response regulator
MFPTRPLIALVDDDPSVCKAFQRLIAAYKYEAITFSSGETFLLALSERRPNCVVLDLHMPGLSGIEVMSALADAGCDLPAIIITGRDDPSSKAQCLAAGAYAYFRKPFDSPDLLQSIENALAKSPL